MISCKNLSLSLCFFFLLSLSLFLTIKVKVSNSLFSKRSQVEHIPRILHTRILQPQVHAVNLSWETTCILTFGLSFLIFNFIMFDWICFVEIMIMYELEEKRKAELDAISNTM